MNTINVGLRFLLELVGVGSLALWGSHLSSSPVTRIVLAIVAPLALIILWSRVVAPGAANALSPPIRMVTGSILLLGSAATLVASGHTGTAAVFGALVVVNTVLLLVAVPHARETT